MSETVKAIATELIIQEDFMIDAFPT